MAYEKQHFTDGEVLSASHLNYMEEGLAKAAKHADDNEKEIETLSDKLDAIETQISTSILAARVE